MPTLLKVDSSPRSDDQSISRQLGNQFAREWQSQHSGSVVSRDLAKTDLPFVDTQWIAGAYTPPDKHNEEHKAALKPSDEFIAELKAADHILITAPMYNFSIPAALKAWIDHIVRIGHTFSVSPTGQYSGLVTGKKATVILSSGAAYAGTAMEGYDQETPYLRNILGFIGITDVSFVRAGGTSGLSQGKVSADAFMAPLTSEVRSAATAA